MKIIADFDKCEGLGMCEAMANDFFEVDEDEDKVVVLDDSPTEADRGHVFAAVQACPVLALTLEG
ncbi:ferredoxin [Nocardioides sp. Root190]|uniref:ferredoxin n=1 Tax=Nocardioides sp. Root190 TaxID=1736488 RepID=UPI0006FF7F0A|nr:ferredoxin [Nocardioides sp. Root190]KRB76321.1 ferredoxin [Nocardioides sp. Root190]